MNPPTLSLAGRDEALLESATRPNALFIRLLRKSLTFILYSQLINSFILLNLPSEIPFTFIISSFFRKGPFFSLYSVILSAKTSPMPGRAESSPELVYSLVKAAAEFVVEHERSQRIVPGLEVEKARPVFVDILYKCE